MGRFVGFMTDAALKACFEVIDDASLLWISYFVEAKDSSTTLSACWPTERIQARSAPPPRPTSGRRRSTC